MKHWVSLMFVLTLGAATRTVAFAKGGGRRVGLQVEPFFGMNRYLNPVQSVYQNSFLLGARFAPGRKLLALDFELGASLNPSDAANASDFLFTGKLGLASSLDFGYFDVFARGGVQWDKLFEANRPLTSSNFRNQPYLGGGLRLHLQDGQSISLNLIGLVRDPGNPDNNDWQAYLGYTYPLVEAAGESSEKGVMGK